jgi:hypothetical protein
MFENETLRFLSYFCEAGNNEPKCNSLLLKQKSHDNYVR